MIFKSPHLQSVFLENQTEPFWFRSIRNLDKNIEMWQKNKRIDDAHKDTECWHFSFPELAGMFEYN